MQDCATQMRLYKSFFFLHSPQREAKYMHHDLILDLFKPLRIFMPGTQCLDFERSNHLHRVMCASNVFALSCAIVKRHRTSQPYSCSAAFKVRKNRHIRSKVSLLEKSLCSLNNNKKQQRCKKEGKCTMEILAARKQRVKKV